MACSLASVIYVNHTCRGHRLTGTFSNSNDYRLFLKTKYSRHADPQVGAIQTNINKNNSATGIMEGDAYKSWR